MKRSLSPSLRLLVASMLILPIALSSQTESLQVFDSYQGRVGSWMKYQNLHHAWYQHVHQLADQYLDQRTEAVSQCNTREAMLQRIEDLKEQFLGSIGGLPEKTPLKPQIVGRLNRKSFTVEKLLYQSLPGYYVTACLYLPKERQEPAPAVIYCSGHAGQAFRSTTYQGVILNLVAKGFIVLAFDPIGQGERYQYLDADGQPNRGGPTSEHSYAGIQALLTGSSIARYMINDGIRAVDYLFSRPEVDSTRIGITGRSGGGTQSAYIAAFDSRILAAAPENYITSFRRLWQSNGPQDAEQNFIGGIQRGLDHADLLAVRAPKPAIVLTTTRDIFSIQGARETIAEVEGIYRLFEAEEQFLSTEEDAGHQSTKANREAMYAFFQKYLQLPGDPTDHPMELFKEEELRITQTGQVVTALESKTVFDINKEQFLSNKENFSDEKALRSAIQVTLNITPVSAEPQVVFTGRIQRDDFVIEKYFLEFSDGHYPVPFLHVHQPSKNAQPLVLYLNSKGKEAALAAGGAVEQLVEAGYQVITPDLLNIGELKSTFKGDSHIEGIDYNLILGSSLVGKSLTALRVEDLHHLLDHIQLKFQPKKEKLILVADRGLCTPALHLAALRQDFARLVLKEPLLSLEKLLETRRYVPVFAYEVIPGMLQHYDLPDLMPLTRPASLTVINPQNALGAPLTEGGAMQAYQQLKETYGKAGQAAQFSLKFGITNIDWSALLQ
ncbi:MAG: acetylxylan esterase [Saprospiraceae bacterium]|nr:acetylxylan esterase [Saprospiraceae bacterium]